MLSSSSWAAWRRECARRRPRRSYRSVGIVRDSYASSVLRRLSELDSRWVGAHLTEDPVRSDCRRGKFCVHLLQSIENLVHPLLQVFKFRAHVTVTHPVASSRARASADDCVCLEQTAPATHVIAAWSSPSSQVSRPVREVSGAHPIPCGAPVHQDPRRWRYVSTRSATRSPAITKSTHSQRTKPWGPKAVRRVWYNYASFRHTAAYPSG